MFWAGCASAFVSLYALVSALFSAFKVLFAPPFRRALNYTNKTASLCQHVIFILLLIFISEIQTRHTRLKRRMYIGTSHNLGCFFHPVNKRNPSDKWLLRIISLFIESAVYVKTNNPSIPGACLLHNGQV